MRHRLDCVSSRGRSPVTRAHRGRWSQSRSVNSDAGACRLPSCGARRPAPDLIDKPLSWFAIRDAFENNGHLIAHTLWFALTLVLSGAAMLRRTGDPRLLAVGIATLSHLLVDPVVFTPRLVLWPLFGWEFGRATFLQSWSTIATEFLAGLAIVLAAAVLYRRGNSPNCCSAVACRDPVSPLETAN